jgi:hypothetical protein
MNSSLPLIGRHTHQTDTSLGTFAAIATCNPLAISSQIIYTFTIPNDGKKYGFDGRLSNGFTDENSLDTVLELRKGTCFDPSYSLTTTGVGQDVWCSDDASPPGGVGSRVNALLDAGTYYLILGGYSSETVGPATLDVTITDGYLRNCLSRYCGDDGHGGSCGECDVGFECSEFRQCKPSRTSDFCTTDKCKNNATEHNGIATRTCGTDECGGSCGACNTDNGELCQFHDGVCVTAPPVCNHLQPVCSGCLDTQWCGTDCQCHLLSDALPDLRIDVAAMEQSILIDKLSMDNITCAYAERCISGSGERTLLRFDTTTLNTGLADLILGDPTRLPWEYSFSACHNHWHYSGYAQYQLLDADGKVVAVGHKQGYCMADSLKRTEFKGPGIPCRPQTDCSTPGISRGYSDTYGNSIDCQWVDVTDVAPGDYWLRVELNVERRFVEATPENNVGIIAVTIPDPSTL